MLVPSPTSRYHDLPCQHADRSCPLTPSLQRPRMRSFRRSTPCGRDSAAGRPAAREVSSYRAWCYGRDRMIAGQFRTFRTSAASRSASAFGGIAGVRHETFEKFHNNGSAKQWMEGSIEIPQPPIRVTFASVRTCQINVRSWEQSGRHLLMLSVSQFDPERT
jgi:hypothetical protein